MSLGSSNSSNEREQGRGSDEEVEPLRWKTDNPPSPMDPGLVGHSCTLTPEDVAGVAGSRNHGRLVMLPGA
jgi:hypothetical protein